MNKILTLICLLAITGLSFAQKGKNYGEKVNGSKAVAVPVFMEEMNKTDSSWQGVLKGTVKEVCKKEGCWLRIENGSGSSILVRMKDHDFTVPKDIDGKTVYVQGIAVKTVTTVKMLKHFAEDAGKTKEEIAAITEPKTEILLEATGVKIPD